MGGAIEPRKTRKCLDIQSIDWTGLLNLFVFEPLRCTKGFIRAQGLLENLRKACFLSKTYLHLVPLVF
jgi:hypothetical protein